MPQRHRREPRSRPTRTPAGRRGGAARRSWRPAAQRTRHDFQALQAGHRAAPHRAPHAGQRACRPARLPATTCSDHAEEADGAAAGHADQRDQLLPRPRGLRGAGARGRCPRCSSRREPRRPGARLGGRLRHRRGGLLAGDAAARAGRRAVAVAGRSRSSPPTSTSAPSPTARAGALPEGHRHRRAAGAPAAVLHQGAGPATASSKALREQVLFAVHNLLRDPPFSRLDLICCRNLLIYLDREVQARRAGDVPLRARARAAICSSAPPRSADAARRPVHAGRQEEPHLPRQPRPRGRRHLPLLGDAPMRAACRASPPPSGSPSAPSADASPNCTSALLEQYAPPSVLVDARPRRSCTCPNGAGRFLQHAERRALAQPAGDRAPGAAARAAHGAVPGRAARRSVETRDRAAPAATGDSSIVNMIVRPLPGRMGRQRP